MGPTMDTEITRQLFKRVDAGGESSLDVSRACDDFGAFDRVRAASGMDGGLEEREPGHRHVSQLFALHPAIRSRRARRRSWRARLA